MTDPVPSDPRALALFALRVRIFAEADDVAPRCGLDVATTEALLEELQAAGLVVHRDTEARSGWRLTAEGRTEGAARWQAEVDDHGLVDAVTEQYLQFRALNRPFLQVCTDWQVADLDSGRINDHTDTAHDAAVLDALTEIDVSVGPICDRLSALLQRYGWYRPRFTSALARARDGEVEAVAAPKSDSYHTVWFELHEDLLVSLGRNRADERTTEFPSNERVFP